MRSRFIAPAVGLAALALALLPAAPSVAHAAPAEACPNYTVVGQVDMAGTYRTGGMEVWMGSCGEVLVTWTNNYGTHTAAYLTTYHAPDGVAARFEGSQENLMLDGAPRIVVKAAERGFVQLGTIGYDDQVMYVYRLRKVA